MVWWVYFVGPRCCFLVIDWILSVLIPFFRITDKRRLKNLKIKQLKNVRPIFVSARYRTKKTKLGPEEIYLLYSIGKKIPF